jgi:hypothetical protein
MREAIHFSSHLQLGIKPMVNADRRRKTQHLMKVCVVALGDIG